ncbi:MAG TPA: SET domain-containing protein [Candidatus Sulfotelmatobacter sp.]|nr:SET domain-containing protein [Candidatus Sulfotelmatobacter sp.]
MLLVKTYLAVSTIHGIGLYAAEPIARGTVIWRFDERVDRRLTKQQRESLPEPARSFVAKYSYPESVGSDVHFMDGDHARFMNHSDDPNTDCTVDTIATRDIAEGEELLCDYRQFHPDHRLY